MKLKFILLTLCLSLSALCLFAQNPSILLEVESTEGGFLPSRMNSLERDAIMNPPDGMIIFNTETGFFNYYDIVFNDWLDLQPQQQLPNTVDISQSMFIGGSEFRPATSANGHISSFAQGGSYITSSGEGRLVAGIPLPVGTLISSITFYYRDNDSTSMMSMELDYESMTSGTFSTIDEYNTSNAFASSAWLSETISPNHTLLTNRAYRIDIYSADWSGDMRIKGVRIDYTLPSS